MMEIGAGLFVIAIAAVVYFLPALVAASRERAKLPIFVLNLFLGWTVLGWVVALVWAVTARTARESEEHMRRTGRP